MRRTRSKMRWAIMRWPYSRGPLTPDAASKTAAVDRTSPEMSDCRGAGLAGRLGARLVVRGPDVELELDAPHALEDALDHHALAVQQVADHAERGQHDGGVEQHRAEDERLHVAGAVVLDVGDDEADPGD